MFNAQRSDSKEELIEPNPARQLPLCEHEIDQILTRIVKAIREIPDEVRHAGRGNGDRAWTSQVMRSFKSLGYELGYWVCPDPFQATAAFLYDLSWYRCDGQERIVETPLVLESEWSTDVGKIEYDFGKLLQAKSLFKVMIFQSWHLTVEEITARLVECIKAYELRCPTECYVLAGFCQKSRKFQFEVMDGQTNVKALSGIR